MSEEEEKTYEALKAEYDKLEDDYAEADELPEEVDERLGEIETAMEALQNRPIRFEAEDYAIAGAFVSIDGSGGLRVERGYVRPEDEPVEETDETDAETSAETDVANVTDEDGAESQQIEEDEEDDGTKPLSDLGRVTKAQILAAVREAKGEKDADRIAGFKKPDMVEAAEELLVGTGWLPQVLRTPPLIDEPVKPEFEIVDDGDVTSDEQAVGDDEDADALQAAE